MSLRAVGDRPQSDILDSFKSTRALVVGEAMLDVYLKGPVTRLSPEGPFPIVDAAGREATLGGAANVAANLAAMGAQVSLVSVTGDDRTGEEVAALAKLCGIDVVGVVRDPRRETLAKLRIVGDDRTIARVDQGSTDSLDAITESHVVEHLQQLAAEADVIVASDYRYGVVSDEIIDYLGKAADRQVVVVDSKDLGRFRRMRPTAVTSNYSEIVSLVGAVPEAGSDRLAHLASLGPEIAASTGAAVAAVTVDADGVVVVDETGLTSHVPSAGRAADPCGGGDTFTAAMSLGLAVGAAPLEAAGLASRAAAIVVARHGTAVCSLEQLRNGHDDKWCPDVDTLVDIITRRRMAGQSIVFTNGCFDVLHAGHVASLKEAASMGDVLIVALNSDASIARLKGDGRPVNELADRAAVIAGLSVVDHVVAFDEESPLGLLRRLRPDVYCKGGDYRGRWIPEMDLVRSWGGRFELTSYLPDRSTTATVEKVRAQAVVGVGARR
ncbi:MAG TPA: PfkB family carbohydrate kinase [Acidimicrobiia bacterium]|nr:PfkB family carbohydrate kinase [Acidimicrobiia bacterium]